jgi:hypothetical protein
MPIEINTPYLADINQLEKRICEDEKADDMMALVQRELTHPELIPHHQIICNYASCLLAIIVSSERSLRRDAYYGARPLERPENYKEASIHHREDVTKIEDASPQFVTAGNEYNKICLDFMENENEKPLMQMVG